MLVVDGPSKDFTVSFDQTQALGSKQSKELWSIVEVE